MMTRAIVQCLLLASIGINQSCSSEEQPLQREYQLQIRVRASTGEPLAGTAIYSDAQVLGTTDANGSLVASRRGREGQVLEVGFRCPSGYKSPTTSERIRLNQTRSLEDSHTIPGIRVEAICESELRDVVVVVRASGGAGLPIHAGTDAAGQTDPDGNAHLLLRLPRDQNMLDIGLDTDSRQELIPRNPSRTFILGRNDAVVVYSEQISVRKKKTERRFRALPVPNRTIPIRLD